MAVAFDAVSEYERTGTEDPATWTHTSVGQPRGVLVFGVNLSTNLSDITSISYGGKFLQPIQSPRRQTGQQGGIVCYFAGGAEIAAVPSGTATVTVDMSSATTNDWHFVCYTVTASGNVEPYYWDTTQGIAANPQVTMRKGGRSGWSAAQLFSGIDSVTASSTLATGNTAGPTMNASGATKTSWSCYETTVDASSHTLGWSTLASDDYMLTGITLVEEISQDEVIGAYVRSWNATGSSAATGMFASGLITTNEHDDDLYLINVVVSGTATPTIVSNTASVWTQIGAMTSTTAGNGLHSTWWYYVGGNDEVINDTLNWGDTRMWRGQTWKVYGADMDAIASGTANAFSVTGCTNANSAATAIDLSLTPATSDGGLYVWNFCSVLGASGSYGVGNGGSKGWMSLDSMAQTTAALKNTHGFRDERSGEAVRFNEVIDERFAPFGVEYTFGMVGVKRSLKQNVFKSNWENFTSTTATSITARFGEYPYTDWVNFMGGYATGDLVIADITSISAVTANPAVTAAAGWTQIGNWETCSVTASTAVHHAQFYKKLTASDIGVTQTFTFAAAASAGMGFTAFRGASTAPDISTLSVQAGTAAINNVSSTTAKVTARPRSVWIGLPVVAGTPSVTNGTFFGGFSKGATYSGTTGRARRQTKVTSTSGTSAFNTFQQNVAGNSYVSTIFNIPSKYDYGQVTNPYSFNIGTNGQSAHVVRGDLTWSEVLSIATAGTKGYRGIVQSPFTINIQTIGTPHPKYFGIVQSPFVVNIQTIGKPTRKAVTQQTYLANIQVIGKKIGRGVVQLTVADNIQVIGKRIARGVSQQTYLVNIFVAPLGGTRGVVQATFVPNIVTQGSYVRRGVVQASEIFNVQSIARGTLKAGVPFTIPFNVQSIGKRTALGTITDPLLFNVQSIGRHTGIGAVSSPFSVNIAVNGRRLATGIVQITIVDNIQTIGRRLRTGVVQLPITDNIQTIARASRTGSVTFPITMDIEAILAGIDWTLVVSEEASEQLIVVSEVTETLAAAAEDSTLTLVPLPEEVRY